MTRQLARKAHNIRLAALTVLLVAVVAIPSTLASHGQERNKVQPAIESSPASAASEAIPSVQQLGDGYTRRVPALGLQTKKSAVHLAPKMGNWVFRPAASSGTGGYLAWSIAVGDLNGDGKPDMVVANQYGTVGVLLGQGDGTFLPAVGYATGGGALSVVIADVNGDHKPDLIVANAGGGGAGDGNTVAVFLGNGDGTFQTAVLYGSGGYSTASGDLISISLVVEDVNGDGKADVIVANHCAINDNYCSEGTVGVLVGNGDGTFKPVVSYGSGGYLAGQLAVADLNGDGKLDLIVTNCATTGSTSCAGNGVVGVLIGNGNGTFQLTTSYSLGSPEWFSTPIVVADINGDGKPDLLVANEGGNGGNGEGSAGVLLGNGNGTFQPVVTYDSGGEWATAIAVADVNGDGKPDLVLANFSASIGVLLGKGDGTFQPVQSFPAGGTDSFSVLVADVDGDGRPDVLVANLYSSVGVLLGNGDGSFQTAQSYAPGGFLPSALAVADVNGDGRPDLLLTNWCTDQNSCSVGQNETGVVSVFLNDTEQNASPTVPTVALTPIGPLTFGPLAIGTAGAQSVTVTNTGTAVVNFTSIVVTGAGFLLNPPTQTAVAGQVVTGPEPVQPVLVGPRCPLGAGTLAVGTSCVLNVTFMPQVVGTATGQVTFMDDAAFSPQTIALSGTGILPASHPPVRSLPSVRHK
jgi:FG-GAP-like repeat/FG-GAP repeat